MSTCVRVFVGVCVCVCALCAVQQSSVDAAQLGAWLAGSLGMHVPPGGEVTECARRAQVVLLQTLTLASRGAL